MRASVSIVLLVLAVAAPTAAQDAAAGRYHVQWRSVDVPATMQIGRDQFVSVTLRNGGDEVWTAGTVYVSYHWYASGKKLAGAYETPQTRIPQPIPPGQEARVDKVLVLPPGTPGSYELQITLVDRHAWFENRGAATVTVPVTVSGALAARLVTEEAAGQITMASWLILALVLTGAAIARARSRPRAVTTLLATAAVTALLLAIVPVVGAPVRHLAAQPFPDSAEYADAARHLVQGDGYVTTAHGGQPAPPLYPPAFSMALAPFAALGDYPGNVQTGAKWFAVAYAAAAAVAAWSLAGPFAALLTSLAIATSPFARTAGTLVLSDAFSVALLLVLVVLLRRTSTRRVAAAGLIAGLLVAVRLNMAIAFVAAALAIPSKHWKALALGAAPVLAALAVYQWLTFGHPLRTGYDYWVPNLTMFHVSHPLADAPRPADGVGLYPDRTNGRLMRWVCPCPGEGPQAALSNVWFYPAVLSGVFWVFAPPFVTIAGFAFAWRRRHEPAARFTLLLTAGTLLVFTFYYYQAARFVAAPATLLTLYAAIGLTDTFRRRARRPAEAETAGAAAVVYEPALLAVPAGAAGLEPVSPVFASPAADGFRLTVIVPVFNERYVVEESLRRLLAISDRLISSLEVIVVDDGSRDGTREILERFADREPRVLLLRHPANRGKGAAIRTGIDHATGDITLIHDADLEYHPEDIPSLLVPFRVEGADAVFGSRYLSARYRRALMHRHTLMNRTLTFLSNWLTDLNLTDLETCYKAVNTTLLKSIPLRSDDFRIEVELPFKLAKRRARIYEVPIRYSPRTYEEGKKIRARDGVLALKAMAEFALIDDLYKRDEYGSQILVSLERARRFNAWMAETLRPYLGTRVLEIGAGIGNLTGQFIPRERYVASDINPHYLRYLQSYASGKPYLQVVHADVTDAADFSGLAQQFDTVVMLNVLEHVADEGAALRNVWSALRPGGRAIVLVPQHPGLFGTLDTALDHRERYSPAGLRSALQAAGFEIDTMFDFNRVSVPGWWVNGRALRRRSFSRVQLKVFDSLTPLLKRIDRWWPWPGLSIIAVASKRGAPMAAAGAGSTLDVHAMLG